MSRAARSIVTTFASVLVLAGTVVPAAPASALADTLGAVSLPMWQPNGTVYAMSVVNGVLYAGGAFTSVRPPGDPPGVGEVARLRLAAFDASTGDLLDWDPSADDTVQAITPSPDGTRIYVGGTFLAAGGAPRKKLAAFDTSTGNLIDTWTPSPGGNVSALDTYGSTIYVGGSFTSMNGSARQRLAAVDTAGATLPWAPSSDKTIKALVVADNGTRVVVGGYLDSLNGQAYHGLGAVDPVTGANTAWATKQEVPTCSIVTVLADLGPNVYVGAEGTGGGCFDGTLAVRASDGVKIWRDNCLGATQAVQPLGDYLYVGSHSHNCSAVPGGFPEQYPRAQHFLAESLTGGGIGHWFPNTNGNPLGPEAMTTDGQQLFVGGDFTTVNKKPQQGLTRFSFATNARPTRSGSPSATSALTGKVTITWQAVTDTDDESLTYRVYRDGGPAPIGQVVASSKFWNRPMLSFVDSGLAPGSTHTYKVDATDGVNVGAKSPASNQVTVSSTDLTYRQLVLSDSPLFYWRLGDGGTTASDATGNGHTGQYRLGTTRGLAGAIAGDADKAVGLDGTKGIVASNDSFANPQTFSAEIWFKTTTTGGGKIAGFGNSQTGTSTSYDRHLYLTNNGKVVFGVFDGATRVIESSSGYNNGAWHHVVGTFGGSTMTLYVDGAQIGQLSTGGAQSYTGYWRVGGDTISGWPDAPSSKFLQGTVDELAVYPTELSGTQASDHYQRALVP